MEPQYRYHPTPDYMGFTGIGLLLLQRPAAVLPLLPVTSREDLKEALKPPAHPTERLDKMKVLGVRVTPDLYKLMQKAAYKREMSLSDHVRDVLKRGSEHWLKQPRESDA